MPGNKGLAQMRYPEAARAHQGDWPAGAAAIRMLAVSPGSRGRGYGRRLTQAALEMARELGLSTIYLYTGTFMTAARRLYEDLGFQRAREFSTATPAPSPTGWTSSEGQFSPQ